MRISDWSSDVCSSDLFATAQKQFIRPAFSDDRPHVVPVMGIAFEPRRQQRPVIVAHQAQRDRAISGAEQPTGAASGDATRSEEHTSELQSLMRISYAVFCLKKKKTHHTTINNTTYI